MAFVWADLYDNIDIQRDDFITDFRILIDEDDPDILSNDQLVRLIYLGLKDISRTTGLNKTYADNTTLGSESYELPRQLAKLDDVVYIDASGDFKSLIKLNPEEVEADGFRSSGIASAYVRNGNFISVYGIPSTGTLRIYGTKIPELPDTGTSYIDLPQQYIELLLAWLQLKYYLRKRDPQDIQYASQYYESVLQDVKEEIASEYDYGVSLYGKSI